MYFTEDPIEPEEAPARKRKPSGHRGRKTSGRPKGTKSAETEERETTIAKSFASRGKRRTGTARSGRKPKRPQTEDIEETPSECPETVNNSGRGCLCKIVAIVVIAVIVSAVGIDVEPKKLVPFATIVAAILFALGSPKKR